MLFAIKRSDQYKKSDGYRPSLMKSAMRSPTIMAGQLVAARGWSGKIEASATRSPSIP